MDDIEGGKKQTNEQRTHYSATLPKQLAIQASTKNENLCERACGHLSEELSIILIV